MDWRIGTLGLLLHLILIYSIFDIYYTSPIINGLPAHRPISKEPPAKRLFLISADGLRYDTIMDNKELAPYLHSLIDNGMASSGVSHSHVPTESRPGHLALVAGFTEDVSAVTRGWKENPVAFDTIFNRSIEGWQWGSEDITHLFSKIKHVRTGSFPSDWEDFSSLYNYKMDEWVFDKCEAGLRALPSSSLNGSGRLFFLHLVAIDTNGHGHKPDSSVYKHNLKVVDNRVRKLVETVNEVFGDDKTAFLFTSDHGMTPWGSHGGGSDVETKTPFIIWGSGVNKGLRGEQINQVDLCPMMASLLSVPFPTNNHGLLPRALLNATARFEAMAVLANFHQIREILVHQIGRVGGRPWLSSQAFTAAALKNLYEKTIHLANQGRWQSISSLVTSQLPSMRDSIFLYHRVDRPLLSCMVAIALIAFTVLLRLTAAGYRIDYCPSWSFLLLSFVISMSSLPFFVSTTHLLYLLLPLYVLSLIPLSHLPTLLASTLRSPSSLPPLLLLLSLYFSFYDRRYSSLFSLYLIYLPHSSAFSHSPSVFSLYRPYWYTLCLLFLPFPFLPISGLLSLPLLAVLPPLFLSLILYLLRPHFPSSSSTSLLHPLIALSLFTSSLILLHTLFPSSSFLRLLSWLSLLLPYPLVYRTPPRSPSRLLSLSVSLFLPYSLLSSSYESLYLLLLLLFLSLFTMLSSTHPPYFFFQLPLSSSLTLSPALLPLPLLLTFLSLFSTGNLATLSSFSPSSLSRFVSVFSPFTMALLLLLKLLSPVLLMVVQLRSSLPTRSMPAAGILLAATLVYSDLLSLLFFFSLRDSGSWLDIGMSIAHLIISLCSSCFFYVLFMVADWALTVTLYSTVTTAKHLSSA